MLIYLYISVLITVIHGGYIEVGLDNFIPDEADLHICGSTPLNEHPYYYINSLTPKVNRRHIHHFQVFLCEEPGSHAKLWNYDAPVKTGHQAGLPTAHFCKKRYMTVGAFSYNTNGITLPKNTSIEAGWATRFKYIVFDIHFKSNYKFKDGEKDSSKLLFGYQTKRTPFTAGTFTIKAGNFSIVIPKHSKTVVVSTAVLSATISPFIYKVHTHDIGTRVSAYWVKKNQNETGESSWIEIGSAKPFPDQLLLPTKTKGPIEAGDKVVVKCFYDNFRDVDVHIGFHDTDEMCEFGILYSAKYGGLLRHSLSVGGHVYIPEEE